MCNQAAHKDRTTQHTIRDLFRNMYLFFDRNPAVEEHLRQQLQAESNLISNVKDQVLALAQILNPQKRLRFVFGNTILQLHAPYPIQKFVFCAERLEPELWECMIVAFDEHDQRNGEV